MTQITYTARVRQVIYTASLHPSNAGAPMPQVIYSADEVDEIRKKTRDDVLEQVRKILFEQQQQQNTGQCASAIYRARKLIEDLFWPK